MVTFSRSMSMSSDEADFLSLVLARRPDLKDLLLKPTAVLCNEAVVVLQATASLSATRTEPIQCSSPAAPAQASPPRKLSIKSHIEGPAWNRQDVCAQLPRPSAQLKNAGALVGAQPTSDTETSGAAALGAPTGDECTSDEEPGDPVVGLGSALGVQLELDCAAPLSDTSGQPRVRHALASSRRGTYDGVVPVGARPVTFDGGASPPVPLPHRFRSNSSPCGIQLAEADDVEDENNDDGDGDGEEGDVYDVYSDAVARGQPSRRHLAASPSFRDMAVGWGRYPSLETMAGLRLDGVAVRGASPLGTGSSPHSPVSGSRHGGGREPHPGSPSTAAAAAAAAAAHHRRRAGSQGGSLPAATAPPLLLVPACLPRRLARTPDAGFRGRSQSGDGQPAGRLTQIDSATQMYDWGDIRRGRGVVVPMSLQAACSGADVGSAAGGAAGAPQAAAGGLPDPRVAPRSLRNCHSSGLQSFLPSSRAKLIAARLQRLSSSLARSAVTTELVLAGAAEVDAAESGAEELTAEGQAPAPSGAHLGGLEPRSSLIRMASSPARMMILRSPLPFLSPGELDCEGELVGGGPGGQIATGDGEWGNAGAKVQQAAASLSPAEQHQHQHQAGAGDPVAPSARSRSVTSSASRAVGGEAVSVHSLAAAAAAASSSSPSSSSLSHGDHAGVIQPLTQPVGVVASDGAAAGHVMRQALQLPVRQPQPPLLPYGGILRLAVSQSCGGLPFAAAHQRGCLSVGRQGTLPPPAHQQQQQVSRSLGHWPLNRSCAATGGSGGGGGSGGSGGHGGGGPQPSASRGAQVLRSIGGGGDLAGKALASQQLYGAPQAGAAAAPPLPGNSAAGGRSAASTSPMVSPPRRTTRCSESGAVARLEGGGGGSGGSTPGCVGGGSAASGAADGDTSVGRYSVHTPMLLADFLAAEAESGGLRLGVLGNCRPAASTTPPPLLPSLKHQKGLRGSRGSPGRPRHVLPTQAGPLVKQEHLKAIATAGTSPERGGGGGGGGATAVGGGGNAAAAAVAVVLAVADGAGPTSDMRQHRHYKLGFAAALAAPSPSVSASSSAAASAAARHSGEASPLRPVGLLPVINQQVSMRPAASKLPASAPVPFPTVTQQHRNPD